MMSTPRVGCGRPRSLPCIADAGRLEPPAGRPVDQVARSSWVRIDDATVDTLRRFVSPLRMAVMGAIWVSLT